MKTVNYQTLKKYDDFKDQIFRSKVNEFKNNHQKNSSQPKIKNIKSIIPWRFFARISVFSGLSYLMYQYHRNAIDYLIQKGHLNQFDFFVFSTVLEDFTFRLKSLLKSNNKHCHSKIQRFSNKFYKSKLDQHYNYIKKTFAPYIIKSQVSSKWQIWVTGFSNLQKMIFVNEFGDVIERHQTSKIRLWSFPIWKKTTDRVISVQPTTKAYQTLINSRSQTQNLIGEYIQKNCKSINILNMFSNNYDQLIKQCRANLDVGAKIDKHVKSRLQFIKKIQSKNK